MANKCPDCQIELEPCMGAEKCPDCKEVWAEEDIQWLKDNLCPTCGGSFLPDKTSSNVVCQKCHTSFLLRHINDHYKEDDVPAEPYETTNFDSLLAEIEEELVKADDKHGPMLEPVEGLYTLRCEVTELAREVHRHHKDRDAARKECIQVITMGVKFLRDCVPMIEGKEAGE